MVDGIEGFNSLPAGRLEQQLLACCAATAWTGAVVRGRPYPDKDAVLAAADEALRGLDWENVAAGLAGHPRIGERATGWSRQEQQAASDSADDRGRVELIEVNRAYEERFGHVFLIFASGRGQGEILAAARDRLGNDVEAERVIVADELRRIALHRLERVLDGRA